ncbi:S1 family peptidase [Bdellovibrio sp. GT3]|uniref:S1 family peptidase n=1 Tax=Bdellovibrio sp. GT3 TaxID=3136282 RepID=UPI0030F06566
MKNLSLGILLLLAVGCSRPQAPDIIQTQIHNNAIIGGEPVTADSYARSATVGIYYRGSVACTGVLISKNLVITAAHCVKWVNDVQVGFGEAILPADQLKNVAHIIPHPDFEIVNVEIPGNTTETHVTSQKDVALLMLAENAPAGFVPAVIHADTDSIPLQSTLLLAGFGLTDDMTREPAKSLLQVEVSLFNLIDDYLVLDQRNGKGACFGDSGGPAYLADSGNWYVVGVTHGTRPGYTDCSHETDYTSLSKHMKFIMETADLIGAELPYFGLPLPPAATAVQAPLAAQ